MRCDKCRNEAAFFQSSSGRYLCSRHLALDIEARAKRTIRSHRWMRPGDHIAVVVSGDRKSAALLSFLKKLTADRRDIRLSALPSCGTDTGTGDRPAAVTLAESPGVPVIQPVPDGISLTGGNGTITRIARATSLDDIAERVLEEFLFGDADRLVHPRQDPGSPVPVICPFITISSDELDLYAEIGIPGSGLPPGVPVHDTRPKEIRVLLDEYSRGHPATKYALLHLAEQISGDNVVATGVGDIAGPGIVQGKNRSPQKRPNS